MNHRDPDEAKRERRRVWALMLTSAMIALGRQPFRLSKDDANHPENTRLRQMIEAFEAICRPIPTRHLQESYERSLRLIDKNGQPVFWDARALWLAWTQLRAEANAIPPDMDEPRPCRQTHATFSDADEPAQIECQNPLTREDYFLPCPDCRPSAFRQKARERQRVETHSIRPLAVVESLATVNRNAPQAASDTTTMLSKADIVRAKVANATPLRCDLCGLKGLLFNTHFASAGQTCGARIGPDAFCEGLLEEAK